MVFSTARIVVLLFSAIIVTSLQAGSADYPFGFFRQDLGAINPAYVGEAVYVFPDPCELSATTPSDGPAMAVTINVFDDLDNDGTDDGAGEPGVVGLTVTAFTDAGTPIVLTDNNDGSYTLPAAGGPYRVEITNIPSYLEPGVGGTTTTFFLNDGQTATIPLVDPSRYCNSNPRVAVPCYDGGTASGKTTEGLISTNYSTILGSSSAKRTDAQTQELGTTWGLAFKKTNQRLFASAFTRRHAGEGPRGFDGVYVFDYNNTSVPLLGGFDLGGITPANAGNAISGGANISLGTVSRVTTPATADNYLPTSATDASRDLDAFNKVGRVGFGDIELSEDENTLWLVNLNQRALISVDISSYTPATTNPIAPTGAVNQYLIDQIPGLPACTSGTAYPWGLKFHEGRGYLGVICNGEGSQNVNNVIGYVLSFDPTNIAAGFTTEVTIPMNYTRESWGGNQTCCDNESGWRAWVTNWAQTGLPTTGLGGFSQVAWPQPIVSDIEFADNGDMVIGVMDRFAMQMGAMQTIPVSGNSQTTTALSNGDILHACSSGGGFILEDGGTTCGHPDIRSNANVGATSGTLLTNDGPGNNGEYYFDDFHRNNAFTTHKENALGSMAVLRGQGTVLATVFDPIDGELNANGFHVYNTSTGVEEDNYEVFGNGSSTGDFGKQAGLGDVEFICAALPIQVGNYLWADADGDGIQDPGESGIAGATVELWADTNGDGTADTKVAETTTNASGQYLFRQAGTNVYGQAENWSFATDNDRVEYNTAYEIRIPLAQAALGGLPTTTQNANGVTDNNNRSDLSDSDAATVGGNAVIAFVTGNQGENNYNLDAGFGVVQQVCSVTIARVSVSECFFDEATGESLASVEIEVSWENPPGPAFTPSTAGPRRDRIAVEVNGETKFVFLEAPFVNRQSNIEGYYELSPPQLVRFVVPADGMSAQTITANFESDLTCADSDVYDRPAACPTDPCVADANTVGGNVFEDLNLNGNQDNGEPTGVPGIMVSIYGCDDTGNSVLLGTTTTDTEGNYYFDDNNTSPNLVDGEDYRVEFMMPGGSVFEPTCGNRNGYTTVQFATSPSCDVSLGLVDPSTSCQENPDIVITCYVGGPSTGSGSQNFGTIVSYPFDAPAGNFGINSGENSGPSNTYYGYHNQTGAIWGLAYRSKDSLMFSSSVLRRHTGFGPLGKAGIYVTDFAASPGTNGTNAPTTNFLDLSFGGTFDFGTIPARSDLGTSPTASNNRDVEAFSRVGTIGMGDLEIAVDGNTLYTVNLFDKSLYQIDISGYDGTAATLPSQANVSIDALPNPCINGEIRPWALKIRGNNLYVGFICDASGSDQREDLRAYVYIFNTLTGTFNTTPIFDFPLNYPRGAGILTPGLWEHNVWEPWSNDWQGNIADQRDWYRIQRPGPAGSTLFAYDYPQPILADIEIDVDNTLILVFNDRTSSQTGNRELAPTGNTLMTNAAAGDILRAFSPDGITYILESEAISGGLTGAGPGNFQGPGYGEFFDDNYFSSPTNTNELVHSELVVGGAAIAPGSGLTVVAVIDPTNGTNQANGTRTYDNSSGMTVASYSVFTSSESPNSPTFAKTAGLGDIELLCNPFQKLELGNYAWLDENEDGIQDPCEPPLVGLSVGLYAPDGTLLATTTTNADGEYYFSEDGATGQVWVNAGDGLEPMTDYLVVFGDGQFDPMTGLDLGANESYPLTINDTGQAPNADLNDSDVDAATLTTAMGDLAAGLPFIPFTTPESGVDHSLDVGFIEPERYSLGSTVFIDQNNNGMQDPGDTGIPMVPLILIGPGGPIDIGLDGILGSSDDNMNMPYVTDASGNYFFQGLLAGDYTIQIPASAFGAGQPLETINVSSTPTVTVDNEMDGDDNGIQTGGSGTLITSPTITLGEADGEPTGADEDFQGGDADDADDANGDMTVDFGVFAPVSVGDTTFVDLDNNGLQDPTDPALAGVSVTLFTADGVQVTTDVNGDPFPGATGGVLMTNSAGFYQFANLPPGDYYVVFDISTAPGAGFYELTEQNVGGNANEADDSDAAPNGQIGQYRLPDFGY